MNKIIKDPLVHFLFIGLVLFFVYDLVNNQNTERDEIIIDSNEINQLVAKWEMQWKRAPTKEELTNLIIQDVRQEVFYQEGLKMNLDHNDEIIKRRLSQKMEFLSNDLATLSEPSDEELQDYFYEHGDKYMLPYIFSLYQIVFTNDKHDNLDKDISSVLEKSKNVSIQDLKMEGDNLSFPFHLVNSNSIELASQFGTRFAKGLETLKLNTWVGPIDSGFGKHLVYLTDRKNPILPDLQQVKSDVLRDFQYDKQKELKEAIFQTLKKNYEIVIDVSNSDYDNSFRTHIENQLKN